MNDRPRVGVGVMVWKDGKILIGQRRSELAQGEWSWPGGHLEHMESIEECARREVREEAGIEIENVRFLRLVNLKDYAPKHYVDIGMMADWKSGEPRVCEPDKMISWEWRSPDDLPSPVFAGEPYYLDALKTGRVFYDA